MSEFALGFSLGIFAMLGLNLTFNMLIYFCLTRINNG